MNILSFLCCFYSTIIRFWLSIWLIVYFVWLVLYVVNGMLQFLQKIHRILVQIWLNIIWNWSVQIFPVMYCRDIQKILRVLALILVSIEEFQVYLCCTDAILAFFMKIPTMLFILSIVPQVQNFSISYPTINNISEFALHVD